MGHASKMVGQKGCHLCKPHKFRDAGQAHRKRFAELRRLGKLRRVGRHDLGDVLFDSRRVAAPWIHRQ